MLTEAFEKAFASRTRDEWAAIFEQLDACTTPVLCWEEAPHHPHISERGTVVYSDGVAQSGPAPRFSRTPARLPEPMRDPIGVDEVLAGWAS
ncbi:MAG: CoA transferase [Haloechinothrix sp.]